MTHPATENRCPHCGSETDIVREGGSTLPGGLHPHEFEILVRNEWRRKIGPDGYDRWHGVRLVRILARIASESPSSSLGIDLERELHQLVADLAARGEGRLAVRREVRRLVHAMRRVLLDAGADGAAVESFVASAHRALQRTLGYPNGRRRPTSPDLGW